MTKPSPGAKSRIPLTIKQLGWAILLAVFLIYGRDAINSYRLNRFTQIQNEADEAAEMKSPRIDVSAEQMCSEYDRNEVNADDRYKNRWVKISGRISRISSNGTDSVDISLSPCLLTSIRHGHVHEVRSMNRGDAISLNCRIGGRAVFNIIASDCAK